MFFEIIFLRLARQHNYQGISLNHFTLNLEYELFKSFSLVFIHVTSLVTHLMLHFSIYAQFLSLSGPPKPMHFSISSELQGHNWWCSSSLTSASAEAFNFYPGLLNVKPRATQAFVVKQTREEHGQAVCWQVPVFFQGHTLQQIPSESKRCSLECFGPVMSGGRSNLVEAVSDRLVASDLSRR